MERMDQDMASVFMYIVQHDILSVAEVNRLYSRRWFIFSFDKILGHWVALSGFAQEKSHIRGGVWPIGTPLAHYTLAQGIRRARSRNFWLGRLSATEALLGFCALAWPALGRLTAHGSWGRPGLRCGLEMLRGEWRGRKKVYKVSIQLCPAVTRYKDSIHWTTIYMSGHLSQMTSKCTVPITEKLTVIQIKFKRAAWARRPNGSWQQNSRKILILNGCSTGSGLISPNHRIAGSPRYGLWDPFVSIAWLI